MRLRASFGTLGFLDGSYPPGMRTAYFMLDGECVFDCAFCTHAKNSSSESRFLSRIVWKEIDPETAVEIASKDQVKRVCIQVVSYPGYREDLLELIEKLNFKKISVSVRALTLSEVDSYFEAGVDAVGIPIDAVTEELFSEIRGGSLRKHLDLIEKSAEKHPGRVTTHIVVGLGETERDVVDMIFRMYTLGVRVALFAFTPMKGTRMESHPRPSLESYRKIQVVRYLAEKGVLKRSDVIFDEGGKIVGINIDGRISAIEEAFLTSGCEDCTRPFYNENPGGELYNVHDEKLLRKVQPPPIASFRTSTTRA